MINNYIIKCNNNAVEMTKPNSTMLIYKIPYKDIEARKLGFLIPNPFIVYILFGKNPHGKDKIYVGKSKNGITYRPAAHVDKYDHWTTCYVLTQFKERTFFNDGTIQYLEDTLNHRINEIDMYCNTTINTTSGTANKDDEEYCDDYLAEAYKMLNILGLDLITNSEEAKADEDMDDAPSDVSNREKIPDGIYYFSRKIKRLGGVILKGRMQVQNHTFILLEGSDVAPEAGIGLAPNVDELRNRASIENGKLMENMTLNSPSACGEFITGAACNGWTYWETKDGQPITIFRK